MTERPTHPALASAQRAIAVAPTAREKLRILEREALSLRAHILCGDIDKADAFDGLCQAGANVGLRSDDVKHVVRNGLNGIATLMPAGASVHGQALTGIATAAALQQRNFPPLKFVVQELLPEGLTLLAGAPKIGKSWLCLDLALAVAAGRSALGDRNVDQGDVLYLALEDGERRLKGRLHKLKPGEPWPDAFKYAVEWPQGDEGVARIEQWCANVPTPRLVVVDVLEKIRRTMSDRNVYAADYAALSPLQKLAIKRSIAIMVVTHTSKGKKEAAVERITGSLALPGAADAWLVLDRNGSGATLVGSGRDAPDVDLAVEFNRETCRWTVLGHASEVRRASERGRVLSCLQGQASGVTARDLADELGLSAVNARQLLSRMARAGEVVRYGRGIYFHPGAVTTVTPSQFAQNAGGRGSAGSRDDVTNVTPPDWQLPLLAVKDGSK